MDKQVEFQKDLETVLTEVSELLKSKNRKYGDSALSPIRVFSKASPSEQLKVRMDDKLSRLLANQLDDTEDVIIDLLGYLIIYRISCLRASKTNGENSSTGVTT